ncbi:MAG: hypothetical protein KAJ75_00390 [Alphaproteobacteria bacterium]|nr:hypothetical protein [Alphaproteobacteria bacterium]
MNNNLSVDYAIHSDFLIHWTGKDIETHEWSNDPQSKTDPKTTDKYIERLRGILKHGFWMTEDTEEYPELDAPKVPQTCFTELRLSQARRHAKKFGRLGIGMKRFFVFNRGGRPLIYYGIKKNGNMVKDPLLEACKEQLKDKKLLNFLSKCMKQEKKVEGIS